MKEDLFNSNLFVRHKADYVKKEIILGKSENRLKRLDLV